LIENFSKKISNFIKIKQELNNQYQNELEKIESNFNTDMKSLIRSENSLKTNKSTKTEKSKIKNKNLRKIKSETNEVNKNILTEVNSKNDPFRPVIPICTFSNFKPKLMNHQSSQKGKFEKSSLLSHNSTDKCLICKKSLNSKNKDFLSQVRISKNVVFDFFLKEKLKIKSNSEFFFGKSL
jgi:hypothetical protein